MTKKLLKKMKSTRTSTISKVREPPLHLKLMTAAKKKLNWRHQKKLLQRQRPRLTSGHVSSKGQCLILGRLKAALIRKYLNRQPRTVKKTFQAKTIIALTLCREY
jgi:hypothetical protein